MRRVVTFCAGLAVGLGSVSAVAQAGQFGNQGTLGISADRLFGIYITHSEYDRPAPAPDVEVDTTEVGLLWHGSGRITPYTIPRAAIDYFVIDHLSLGGTLAFASTNVHDSGRDLTGLLFGPRVGYALMFNDWAGMWPRGGFSYYSLDDDNGNDEDQLAFTAEFMFVLQPAEGVAILVGPTLDLGLTGEVDTGPIDRDLGMNAFGFVSAGLVGWW
jgi:hypothetical protein